MHPEDSPIKNKRPSLRSRATAWAKTAYPEQTLAFAYREGHRVFSALFSISVPFDLDTEITRWRENNTPPLMVDRQAFKAAFEAGAADAEGELCS